MSTDKVNNCKLTQIMLAFNVIMAKHGQTWPEVVLAEVEKYDFLIFKLQLYFCHKIYLFLILVFFFILVFFDY